VFDLADLGDESAVLQSAETLKSSFIAAGGIWALVADEDL
jgi:hypothetical protein